MVTPEVIHTSTVWNWVFLIPILPLLGVIINTFLLRRASEKIVGWFATSTVFVSFILSVIVFFELRTLAPDSRSIETILFEWIKVGKLSIDWAVLIDPLSVVMMLIVTGVGGIIHLYSIGYMHGDPGFRKFFIYLNLFIFFMLWLVMGNSYPILFIGWEGVGLCSYLLIGFWYKDMSKASAGKKAFIVNRIGDWGFLLGMLLLFVHFETLQFTELFPKVIAGLSPELTSTLTLITILLFIGAVGKSAQIPLYVWLPDAMAGPTPVSALIHAATMVTAGIYMVVRSNLLFTLSPVTMELVATIGAITAFYAATIGVRQWDIKKILAYSTVSQLGFMFLGAGVGAYETGIAHVMTHAFFKACLFLGAGAVIHSMEHAFHKSNQHYDPQDIRYMGGLRKKIPYTYWTFLIATIAIAGIPGFSGFFSKDEILWKTFASGHYLLWGLASITAGITAFYMFRLVYLTFFGNFRGGQSSEEHIHEVTPYMTIVLVILAFLSVFGGYLAVPHLLGGHFLIGEWLEPVLRVSRTLPPLAYYSVHHPISLEFGLMGLSVLIAFVGIFLAYRLFKVKQQSPSTLSEKSKGIANLLENKYWVDEIYETIVINPIHKFSIFAWKILDASGIDGFINGVGKTVIRVGSHLRLIQTGFLSNYAMMMSFGILFVVVWLVFGR